MAKNIQYCVCTDINTNSTYKYVINAFETACQNLMKSGIVNGMMKWKNYGLVEICTLRNMAYQINIILNYDELFNLVRVDVSFDIAASVDNRQSIKFKQIKLPTTDVTLSTLIESKLKEYIEEFESKYSIVYNIN